MKKLWQKHMVAVIAIPMGIACILATVFYSGLLAVCEAVLLAVLCAVYVYQKKSDMRYIVSRVKNVAKELDIGRNSSLERAPFLVAAFNDEGDVFWANEAFTSDFFPDGKTDSENITDILNLKNTEDVFSAESVFRKDGEKQYAAYCREYRSVDGKNEYLIYLYDETKLRNTEKLYKDTRLSVVLVRVDNADEIYQNFKESECGVIFGRIEEIINTWAAKHSSMCRKLSASRFLIFAEEKNLNLMIDDKFRLLEYVRTLSYADKKVKATISIGIGKGETLPEADEASKLALDMAQSRGGDQVAIKSGSEYRFFGGVSSGFDRSNKIKSRQIASTLAQLIESCENVVIMGHRYADLDSLGSALGIAAIASYFEKTVNIVLDKETSLAMPIIKKLEETGRSEIVVSADMSRYMVHENTVLVVVDTHRSDFTECPELLQKTNKIVVIDHHRKCVDCIGNPVIFYLSPTASSAAEMVTELCQYISGQPFIDSVTAQCLLSGIALDTRNFFLRTGTRTFEAAAYLRSRGADTVEVRKFFSNDIEINKCRNQIVDSAFNYKGCAISITDMSDSKIRLITSQAADELLNLEDINASFVVFNVGDTVCISARSFGEINVQVIMEKFGGGGHSTMAAAQINGTDRDSVLEKLKEEIDSYYENI